MSLTLSDEPKSHFNPLHTLVGGVSVLDMARLEIHSLDQAQAFLLSYGFDLENEKDKLRVWNFHRRACTYIQTKLLNSDEKIPDVLTDPAQLRDVRYLLVYASGPISLKISLKKWSCAILKVMHVLMHLDNDLFTAFSDDIQDQILSAYKRCIFEDPASLSLQLGDEKDPESVPLKRFDIRPFKTSNSAVTKLLAKPEEVAFGLLDRMGIRFVTRSIHDVFRVMDFLTKKNIINFSHVIPNQSSNNVYPLALYLEERQSWSPGTVLSEAEVDSRLQARWQQNAGREDLRRKFNPFSSQDYRFTKFITRKLIQLKVGERPLSFFYPYEVQIVDYSSYLSHLNGPSSHEEYKKRQQQQARQRVFGNVDLKGNVELSELK